MTRTTETVAYVRQSDGDPRVIEGIVVPYGQVAAATPIGPEAFVPGAFRDSVAKWSTRTDGAKLPFRPAHKERPIGSVIELRDSDEGVWFRARIRDGARGDEYLADVADGLNGVSVEFDAPQPGRPVKGVTIHRQAVLYGIAGSASPAYDGARIALRDMEDTVNETPAPDPQPEPPAPQPAPPEGTVTGISVADRSAIERNAVAQYTGVAVVTRPELIYRRDSAFNYMQDTYLQGRGNSEASQRVQKHQGFLQEIAQKMERDTYARVFEGTISERAGDVLSTEIPGAYPNDYLPGLLTPRILKGRPMGSFYNRIPISDARPRIFPKVTTSTTVAVQSAEGAALSATDLATTAVSVTPLMYGAYTDISRQAIDGGDPSVLAIVFQDLVEAYAQASEAVIKTAVEAGSTASGVAITAATPYAGVLANVVNYFGVRFKPAQGVFIPPAEYSVLLAQGDTTGRPFLPMIGATNSDGTVARGAALTNVLGADGYLSWASTVNVNVFGVPSDFVIYESAIAQFTYDQIVGPQAVRVGLWAYLGIGTRLGSLKVTAA